MSRLPPIAAALALLAGCAADRPPPALEDPAGLDPPEGYVGGGADLDDDPGVLVQPLPPPGGPAAP